MFTCVWLSRLLPNPCHFYSRYHDADDDVNDWTEWAETFNRGTVMPLSLMLLGFGLWFFFFFKANLCTKLLPGNF